MSAVSLCFSAHLLVVTHLVATFGVQVLKPSQYVDIYFKSNQDFYVIKLLELLCNLSTYPPATAEVPPGVQLPLDGNHCSNGLCAFDRLY